MKGLVKVQLIDSDNNVVYEQEEHNEITKFVKNMMTPCGITSQMYGGGFQGTLQYRRGDFIFGCLHVFQDAFDANDNYAVGGFSKELGIARYNYSYTGSNTLYGNYNGSESGWDGPSRRKYVYDFPTSACNGTISSLGLSPMTSVGIGISKQLSAVDRGTSFAKDGYDYQIFKVNNYIWDRERGRCMFSLTDGSNWISAIMHKTNKMFGQSMSCLHDFSSGDYIGSTGKFPLDVYDVPLKSYFERSDLTYFRNDDNVNLHYSPKETIEIELKNTLNASAENFGFVSYHGDHLYLLFSSSQTWAAATSLVMTKYNLITGATEFISIKNTTGKDVRLGHPCYAITNASYKACQIYWKFTEQCACNGEYVLLTATDNTCYSINISDNTKVKNIIWIDSETQAKLNSNYVVLGGWEDSVYIYAVDKTPMEWGYTDSNRYNLLGVNLKTGKVFDAIVADHYPCYDTWANTYVPILDMPLIVFEQNNDNDGQEASFRPTVWGSKGLTTKFNLSSPVIKTSDFSMKVTYIIDYSVDVVEVQNG